MVEDNNGADWIPALIRTVDPAVRVDKVHASRGKALRAQPVAGLYEQGRIHHVGTLALLEEQMCSSDPRRPAPPPTGSTRWCGRSPRCTPSYPAR